MIITIISSNQIGISHGRIAKEVSHMFEIFDLQIKGVIMSMQGTKNVPIRLRKFANCTNFKTDLCLRQSQNWTHLSRSTLYQLHTSSGVRLESHSAI